MQKIHFYSHVQRITHVNLLRLRVGDCITTFTGQTAPVTMIIYSNNPVTFMVQDQVNLNNDNDVLEIL